VPWAKAQHKNLRLPPELYLKIRKGQAAVAVIPGTLASFFKEKFFSIPEYFCIATFF
jgi:hypothetical protein